MFRKLLCINRKRGSLFVDAAVSCPIFIVVLVALTMIISLAGNEALAYSEAATQALNCVPGLPIMFKSIEVDTPLPVDVEKKLVYRPFSGESKFIKDYESNEMVYVFPKGGERFHTMKCWRVRQEDDLGRSYNYTQMDKEDAVALGYTLCYYCKKEGGCDD